MHPSISLSSCFYKYIFGRTFPFLNWSSEAVRAACVMSPWMATQLFIHRGVGRQLCMLRRQKIK